MLAFLAFATVAAVVAAGVLVLVTVVKLVLLPVRLAIGLAKVALLGVAALVFVLVGLPFLAVLVLPLAVLGAVAWGVMRLARA